MCVYKVVEHIIYESYSEYVDRKHKDFQGTIRAILYVLLFSFETVFILGAFLDFINRFIYKFTGLDNFMMIGLVYGFYWMILRIIFLYNDYNIENKYVIYAKDICVFILYSLFSILMIVVFIYGLIIGEIREAVVPLFIIFILCTVMISRTFVAKYFYNKFKGTLKRKLKRRKHG